jgi:hypothetical protein
MSDVNKTRIFKKHFREISKYQISRKFVLCEPSFATRTGRFGATYSRVSQFCETRLKSVNHGAVKWRPGQRDAYLFHCTRSDPQVTPQRLPTLHLTEDP